MTTRLLLACGMIGPLLFVVVFLLEGATRPNYSPWHHFVSSLSQGEQGWMQIINFLVCGVLMLCFAIGLRRVFREGKGSTWGPILLGIFGLALITAGLFVTDPILGYPPGAASEGTLHNAIHNGASVVVFYISLPAACFVLARRFARDPAWRGWTFSTIAAGVLVIVFISAAVVATIIDLNGTFPGTPVGLFQRLSIITGWSWIALFALRLMRREKAV